MSKALFAMFGTDKAVEADGILINYGDVRFRIARAGGGNQKFKGVFKQKSKPYRRQLDNDTMSDETSERLMAEVYAESVILKWESRVNDENGNAVLKDGEEQWTATFTLPANKKAGRDADEVLDFNAGNVVKVLLALPELFADIKEMAAKASNYRQAEDEADAGN